VGGAADFYLKGSNQSLPLDNDWKIMPCFAEPHTYSHSSNNVGTSIYNAMIAPLVPYAMQGVLWYQGETNTNEDLDYQPQLAAMMADWRNQFGAELPFLIVQLAGYGPPSTHPVESNYARVREAQRRAVLADTHAGVTWCRLR